MASGTFDDGSFAVKKASYYDYAYINGETVKVSKLGSHYEITIDCNTSTGKKITGYFKGPLNYEDHSFTKNQKIKGKQP